MGPARALVWEQSDGRCAYCRMWEHADVQPFQVDHIISRKHGGLTIPSNLCVSCLACNAFKSSNIAGLDPATGQLTGLFHPVQDRWDDHFDWNGPVLTGKTPTGRATIEVLRINRSDRVEHRRLLIRLGMHP